MNKIQSDVIKNIGYHEVAFIGNKIYAHPLTISQFIALNHNNYVNITKTPCYLEGTSLLDITVVPLISGSQVQSYNNATIPSGGTLQPRTGYQPMATSSAVLPIPQLRSWNQTNAKKLMELEFSMKNFTNDEIKDLYKQVFNLSDDEIKAIIKEIEDENAKTPNVNQFQYVPQYITTFPNGIDLGTWKTHDEKPQANGNVCAHEMVLYQGLSETFNHCKKCGQKE